jgi:hypothetical protein
MGPTFGTALAALAIDMGPTFGKDFAGSDYNVTHWHSPASVSANHYEEAAKACEAYCLEDQECCSWTYCPPSPKNDERCCLKNRVPSIEVTAMHWTGVVPRAIGPDGHVNNVCADPPPPYPGDEWLHPKIHNSPNCLHEGGWHDIAGALSHRGTHHVFQGCPHSHGWHHAASTDLVHWEGRGIHLITLHETYAGMNSTSEVRGTTRRL